MNQTNDSASLKSSSDVFQKLQEIAAESADGDFSGMAFLHLQKWKKTKVSLSKATELQQNIVMENCGKDYNNVADFEKEISIQLPPEITALLTLPQVS